MLIVRSRKIKSAQLQRKDLNWTDEIRDVDWGDDSKNEEWGNSPINFDSPGIVNEENLSTYLDDEIDSYEDENKDEDIYEQDITDQIRDEIPTSNELLGIPKDTKEIQYWSAQDLLYDAMDNLEVVSFEYTNRHGNYTGLRTVEPHYSFVADTTGNEVVVTFDRDVGDIRAFIIGNIHSGGVRYEGANFVPRGEIMRGVS